MDYREGRLSFSVFAEKIVETRKEEEGERGEGRTYSPNLNELLNHPLINLLLLHLLLRPAEEGQLPPFILNPLPSKHQTVQRAFESRLPQLLQGFLNERNRIGRGGRRGKEDLDRYVQFTPRWEVRFVRFPFELLERRDDDLGGEGGERRRIRRRVAQS